MKNSDAEVTYLDGRLGAVEVPVEDCALGDDAERLDVEPFPEDNLLVHEMRLELLLARDVEHLELPAGLKRKDLLLGMHDGAVGRDGPADDGIGVREVDDDNVGLVTDTDERVGLERKRLEGDGSRLDAERRELPEEGNSRQGQGGGPGSSRWREAAGRAKRAVPQKAGKRERPARSRLDSDRTRRARGRASCDEYGRGFGQETRHGKEGRSRVRQRSSVSDSHSQQAVASEPSLSLDDKAIRT